MIPISVVVATCNRPALVERLLRQLAVQNLPGRGFEVVVVDDGSNPPVAPRLKALALPFALRVIEQKNSGAAVARHAGACAARGDLLVFVDDDMQINPDFLAHHLAPHLEGGRLVVLGHIRPDPRIDSMPLFERWHARLLDRLAEEARTGAREIRGHHLFSGNFSVRREDYLEAGGFDASLGHSEDIELGLRLEKAGVGFRFAHSAWTLHGSDHTSLEKWRRRAVRYGGFDLRISRKHPTLRDASPWRHLFDLHPLLRPVLFAALARPEAGERLATAAINSALLLDRMGLEGPALAGTTAAYALEYVRGARQESGSARACADEVVRFLGQFGDGAVARFLQWHAAVREDQHMMRHYEARYGHSEPSQERLGPDLVQKIGLQIMAAYRAMRVLRDAGRPLAAKCASRMIRHLYGSDIHWDAEIAPGVMIVHGSGMAISRAARVGRGSILFHGVTLGMGIDPTTRRTGAPDVGENVHIGPGATLLGPITIGEGSKIMAGAVVTESVPPGSVVEVPPPTVRSRGQQRNADRDAVPQELELRERVRAL